MTSPAEWLQQNPCFKTLEPRYIQIMAQTATEKSALAGTFIFKQGEAAQHFYLIRSGDVALEMYAAARGVVRIQSLHAAEVLGWSWMLPPYQWHFDARALTDTLLWQCDAVDFLARCEADPVMGYQVQKCFSQIMVQRLQATRLQLMDVYGAHSQR